MSAAYSSNIQNPANLPSLFGDSDNENCNVVRVRGLPYSVTAEQVLDFLGGPDCPISKGVNAVHFTYKKEGGPRGEAYVELDDESSVEAAMKKHNEFMGKRYVEVFRARSGEMEYVLESNGPSALGTDAVIRLRGLPFKVSKEEIAQFFSGLEIVPNGISLQVDDQGLSTGEAFIQFANQDIADKACLKHKEMIGHRYIEIFKSSLKEMHCNSMGYMARQRPAPYDRRDRFGGMGRYGGGGGGGGRNRGYYEDRYSYGGGGGGGSGKYNSYGGYTSYGGFSSSRGGRSGGRGGGGGGRFGGGGRSGGGGGYGSTPGSTHQSKTGHSVHMRGLPFSASQENIMEFFSPLQCEAIKIHFMANGRATGEADVDFCSHDEACEAMKKDKSNMDHRYIELFLNSSPNSRPAGNGPPSLMSEGYGSYGSFAEDTYSF